MMCWECRDAMSQEEIEDAQYWLGAYRLLDYGWGAKEARLNSTRGQLDGWQLIRLKSMYDSGDPMVFYASDLDTITFVDEHGFVKQESFKGELVR